MTMQLWTGPPQTHVRAFANSDQFSGFDYESANDVEQPGRKSGLGTRRARGPGNVERARSQHR